MSYPPNPVAFPHATLGYPQKDGYSLRPPEAMEDSQPIDGVPRFRLIGPTRPWSFTLTFKWNRTQFGAFQTFYHETLVSGTKWVSMTLAMGIGDWPFSLHDSGSRYSATVAGRLWTVVWDVIGQTDDPAFPLPWNIDVINAGGAYTPIIDTILAGTAGDPSSGIIDGGTAN